MSHERSHGEALTRRRQCREEAKRIRTENVRWLVERCFAGNWAAAFRYFGRSDSRNDGVGEGRARTIEGRLRLAIGALERGDFQALYADRISHPPEEPGRPWSTMDMALIRAARLQLLARLGYDMQATTEYGVRLDTYRRPALLDGRIESGLSSAAARALEAQFKLPRYFFDQPIAADQLHNAVHTAIHATLELAEGVAVPLQPIQAGEASTIFWGKQGAKQTVLGMGSTVE